MGRNSRKPHPAENVMKRILITGAAGFIGSHFLDLAVERALGEITVLDAFTYAADERNLEASREKIRLVRGDIRDRKALRKLFEAGVDWLVNFAAETHVDNSITRPADFIETNIVGTHNLLAFALEYGVECFLQISTDEVYGSLSEGYAKEDDAHNPSSPYAASKSAAEQLCNAYRVTYKLPVLIARSTNNFGPRQHAEKFIPVCIANALKGSPIPVYGTGQNQRDWIYVRDNAEALLTVLTRGEPGDVFNVGADCHLPNVELARRILELCGQSPQLIDFVEDRKGHDFRYAVDTTRINALGWKPATDLETGLRKTIEWYKNRTPAS
jgi:dTDP-glucose 4,6-dehydratase